MSATKSLISVAARREAQHEPEFLDTIHAEPCSRSARKVDLPCSPSPNVSIELRSSATTHSRCHCIKRAPKQKLLYGRGSAGSRRERGRSRLLTLLLGMSLCPVQH